MNFAVLTAGPGWQAESYVNSSSVHRVVSAAVPTGDVVAADGSARLALPVADASRRVALQARGARTGAHTPALSGGPLVCVTTLKKDEGPTLGVVGETFSDASSVTSTFVYTSGQTSELGVAISASGEYSGYSADGTVGVSKGSSSGGSSTFPAVAGAVNRSDKTDFDVRIYETAGSGCAPWTTKPVSWSGGATPYSISDVAMGHCVGYVAGAKFALYKTTATTFTSGLSTSAYIGINVSSRTGYSTSADLEYSMGSTGHPVCGKDNYPESGAGLVMVHSSVYTG